MEHQNKINKLNEKAKDMTPEQIIKLSHKEFGKKVAFASSLSEEDQVITDIGAFFLGPGENMTIPCLRAHTVFTIGDCLTRGGNVQVEISTHPPQSLIHRN